MIIDFHTHTFPDKIAKRTIDKLAQYAQIVPFTDGTVGGTLESMNKTGVDMCVCLNIATRPGQENTINNTAAEVSKSYKGRLIAFGSVHPESENALEELDRIKELGLKGVKLHPDYQGFTVMEERLFPIYDRLQELGLITVFHAGWDCYSPDNIHCLPEEARQVALKYPDLKMVLAHFGGMKLWERVRDNLAGLENVYFDTSMAATMGLSYELASEIMTKHPKENILLGSDCPWEDPRISVRYVEGMPVSEAQKELILGKNALSLLGSDVL